MTHTHTHTLLTPLSVKQLWEREGPMAPVLPGVTTVECNHQMPSLYLAAAHGNHFHNLKGQRSLPWFLQVSAVSQDYHVTLPAT